MNFESLIYELLIESVEDVNKIYEKYYSTIPRSRFNSIAKSDRFTKVDKNGEIDKLGKYARLLLTLYSKEGFRIEDLSLAKEYVDVIYKRNVVIPWDKIKSLPDIYPYIKKYLAQDTQSFKDVLLFVDEGEDYVLLHNGNEYMIYQPLTEKGACYLGVGAEWCTTWGPLSLNPRNRDKTSRFKSYSEQSPLFIIADKTDLDKRVQFWFKPSDVDESEFKNLSNGSVDPKGYFYKEELFNFFYPLKEDTPIEELKKLYTRRRFLPHDKENLIVHAYKEKLKETKIQTGSLTVDSEFDSEIYMTLINDENIIEVIHWEREDQIRFDLKKQTTHVLELDNYLSSLQNSKNQYPSERYGSDFDYDLEQLLERFFEEQNELILSLLGESIATNYGLFSEKYLSSFIDKFHSKFTEKFDNDNYSNVDYVYDERINEIEKRVIIKNDTLICFDVDSYNDFVENKDLESIDDFNHFFESYTSYYDINTDDYEFESDIQYDWPSYGDFADDMYTWFTEPFTHEMIETRNHLGNIINKIFKGNRHYIDKEKEITIFDDKINYENKSVEIQYIDRQKNQQYTGYVLIDNLPKYVTMNMLAEQQEPNEGRPQASITMLDWDFGGIDDDFIYIVNLEVKIHTHNKNITYILHLGGNIREDDEYRDDEDMEMLDPMADWDVLDNGNYFIPGNQSVRREIDKKMAEEVISDLKLYDRIEMIFMNIYEEDTKDDN